MVDELRDFIDVVCWRIQAAIAYDPAVGMVLGGDMNKNGMKELEPRLRRYGLYPVFGPRVVTHDRGSHLDDVYTNMHVSCRNVETMKGVSDHHMLLCELKINP